MEEKRQGAVSWKIYMRYASALGFVMAAISLFVASVEAGGVAACDWYDKK